MHFNGMCCQWLLCCFKRTLSKFQWMFQQTQHKTRSTISYFRIKLWWKICSSYWIKNFKRTTRQQRIFDRIKRCCNWRWIYFPLWYSLSSWRIFFQLRINWLSIKINDLTDNFKRNFPIKKKVLGRFTWFIRLSPRFNCIMGR